MELMKKRLYIFLSIILFIFSCKKDDDSFGPNHTIYIDPTPATFTQKILIESFVGEWNPNCPTGQDSMNAMLDISSNKVIGVSIHQGDWLEIPIFYNDLKNYLGGISGFPRAAINRIPAKKGTQIDSVVYSIYNWRINIMELLKNDKTSTGLAISTKEKNNKLEVKVFACTHDTMYKNAYLSVYLIEDSVKSVSQANADSNYMHHQVLTKVLSQNLGDNITLEKDHVLELIYTSDIKDFYRNKKNLKVVALVHIKGNDPKHHQVLNAQSVLLNATQQWD